MSSAQILSNTNFTGNTITASTQFSGSGAGLTNLARNAIDNGTVDHVVINDGSGGISSEAQLSNVRGGTGKDTSGDTGIAKVSSGTWSVATIVDADINVSAAITRTKLASGTANHVMINDGSGDVSSEAQLSNSRGGTGKDTSGDTGVAKVSSGTWSVATIVDADVNSSANITRTKLASGTANQMVVNDNSGVMTDTAFVAISGNDLDLNPTDNVVLQSKPLYYDSTKLSQTSVNTVTTTDAVATDVFSLTTIATTAYTVNFEAVAYNSTDSKSGSYSGLIRVTQGSGGTAPSVSAIVNDLSELDTEMNTTNITTATANDTFKLQVTGLASKTIRWKLIARVVGY
jgi:hypothetical protein